MAAGAVPVPKGEPETGVSAPLPAFMLKAETVLSCMFVAYTYWGVKLTPDAPSIKPNRWLKELCPTFWLVWFGMPLLEGKFETARASPAAGGAVYSKFAGELVGANSRGPAKGEALDLGGGRGGEKLEKNHASWVVEKGPKFISGGY